MHEMLTMEIPFLDTYQDPDMTSTTLTVDSTVDMDLLFGYCRNLYPFPCTSLRKHGVSEEGINFVKSLMVVNPSARAPAALALKSQWLIRSDPSAGGLKPASPRPVETSFPPEGTDAVPSLVKQIFGTTSESGVIEQGMMSPTSDTTNNRIRRHRMQDVQPGNQYVLPQNHGLPHPILPYPMRPRPIHGRMSELETIRKMTMTHLDSSPKGKPRLGVESDIMGSRIARPRAPIVEPGNNFVPPEQLGPPEAIVPPLDDMGQIFDSMSKSGLREPKTGAVSDNSSKRQPRLSDGPGSRIWRQAVEIVWPGNQGVLTQPRRSLRAGSTFPRRPGGKHSNTTIPAVIDKKRAALAGDSDADPSRVIQTSNTTKASGKYESIRCLTGKTQGFMRWQPVDPGSSGLCQAYESTMERGSDGHLQSARPDSPTLPQEGGGPSQVYETTIQSRKYGGMDGTGSAVTSPQQDDLRLLRFAVSKGKGQELQLTTEDYLQDTMQDTMQESSSWRQLIDLFGEDGSYDSEAELASAIGCPI